LCYFFFFFSGEQIVDHLLKSFKGKLLIHIKPADIEIYKTKRKKDGVSGSTINRELAGLKRIFNIAIKNKKVRYNPVTDVNFFPEPPPKTRYLSVEEINNLLSVCSENIKPIVITALNTGMRLSEILDLTWNCVYLENTINPYIEISFSKNGKKRFVPMNTSMIELFKKLKSTSINSEHVFLDCNKKPFNSIRHQFEKALGKAKIFDVCFHSTRHTFASHFIQNGGDLLSLKQILGHSTLKMVERYAHLSQAHKQKMVNKLNFSDKNCHQSVTAKEKEKIAQ